MKISELIWALRQYQEVSGDGDVWIYTADEIPYLAPLTSMANGPNPGAVVLHNSGMDESERNELRDPAKWWDEGRGTLVPDYMKPEPPKDRGPRKPYDPNAGVDGEDWIRGHEESLRSDES